MMPDLISAKGFGRKIAQLGEGAINCFASETSGIDRTETKAYTRRNIANPANPETGQNRFPAGKANDKGTKNMRIPPTATCGDRLSKFAIAMLLATLLPFSAAAQSTYTARVPDTVSVQESVAGGELSFSLIFDGTPGTAQWELNTVDGTAKAGEDYVALSLNSESRSFGSMLPDEAGSYTIMILDDNFAEGDETFTIRLTSSNGSVAPLSWDVTIQDDPGDTERAPRTGAAPILSEMSNHLIAQSEALLASQPRLTDHARSSGNGASGSLGPNGVWGEASFSRSGSRGADGAHGAASLGAHRLVSDNIFLGGMLQFDRTVTKLDGDGRSGEISGKGWMAGPYVVARDPSTALTFEGRLLYGRTSNDVEAVVAGAGDTPLSGTFDGERWIAQARVEGEYPLGGGTIMYPLADLSHARNSADGFDDAAPQGTDLDDAVRTAVSKLQLGAEFEIPLDPARGEMTFRPGLKLELSDRKGVAFGKSDLSSSARVDLGLDYMLDDGVALGFEGYYSGLGGGSEFETYGAGLGLRMDF